MPATMLGAPKRITPTLDRGVSPAARTALYLAGHGWHVFPLGDTGKLPRAGCPRCRAETRDHDASGCPCLADSPTALCHGVLAATADVRITQARAQRYPRANWGVSCGPSGLLAVDADQHGGQPPAEPIPGRTWPRDTPPANGLDVLAALAETAGTAAPTPADTLTVATPSGGRHLLYRVEPGRWKSSSGATRPDGTLPTGCVGWQVDVKSHGGYVVLPGSVTPAGAYRRISPGHEPAPLPAWLAAELRRTGHDRHQQQQDNTERLRRTHTQAHSPRSGASLPRGERIAAGALRSACAELAAMQPHTGRRGKLFRSASRLAGMAAAGWITEAAVRAALEDAGRTCGLTTTEIHSNLAGGFRNPRHINITGGKA